MSSLLKKLAEITLPVDEYNMHLNSQGNVVNEELVQRNFEFLEKKLYKLASNTALLLNQNDKFLSSITKDKNSHFIDPIHAL
ncbi:7244_t:CDS:2 [Racocetra fulgida]|uniref:7244_t:CDS:1 n=1 Tax=Racocetra fulgida TaxID=60492 RepID=A0A9N9AXE6_9GLOM|nr:7244_t:CDS:2 [Racocetra fulgida]